MTIPAGSRVLLFGRLKYFAPSGEIQICTSPEMTPQRFREAVARELTRKSPDFRVAKELASCAVASGNRIISEGETLGVATEFALLPPVCGG